MIGWLLASSLTSAGQLHVEEVGLNDLVGASSHIVLARPSASAPERHVVSVGEGIAPYTYGITQYEPIEWLHPARDVTPGETFEVSTFDAGDLSLHIAYYVRGVSKHPIVQRYRGTPPTDAAEPVLLFLRRDVFVTYDAAANRLVGPTEGYKLTMRGAQESASMAKKVTRLAGQSTGPNHLNVTIAVMKVTPENRAKVDALMDTAFPESLSKSWSLIELKP